MEIGELMELVQMVKRRFQRYKKRLELINKQCYYKKKRRNKIEVEKVETKKEELINNEESKTVKGKKIKVIIQEIIFNCLYPYLIFCISNMCNKEFFLMRKIIFMKWRNE